MTAGTLVPKVDYISMHGPNGWRANKYPGLGPKWIITPRAIFTFDSDGRAQLSSAFAGTSVKWVEENTGFPFGLDPALQKCRNRRPRSFMC